MATQAKRRVENVAGDLFVDSTCIDCDACRWIAPASFQRSGDQSAVYHQPRTNEEWKRGLMALLACPTASIGSVEKHDMADILALFPDRVDGDVYHCGYHHEASFGAATYLIVRDAGNILVDSPRFARPLVRNIEALGGVKTMFLTHRDDVGDHQKFHDHFGCDRILHADDARGPLRNVEHLLAGHDVVQLDDDLELIPVPGHTEGSVCLLFRQRYLFSGDHVAWSPRLNHVYAFRSACWYDWNVQLESMKRLLDFDFEWILPGHGRRCHFSVEQMQQEIAKAVAWME